MCPSGKSLASISAAAMADFRTAFDVIDADRDGKISRDDLKTFYAGFPSVGASDEYDFIGTMISVADSNKDGFVEFSEFERILEEGKLKARKRQSYGVMEDVFKVMDKDGDGKLNRGDLKSFLRRAGFDANDEDIAAMIKLGGGGDGENAAVSFHGLVRILSLQS